MVNSIYKSSVCLSCNSFHEIYLVFSFCFGNFVGEKIFIISPFLQLIYEVTLHKDMFL